MKQELTKGSIDGRVTIESSNTIYCVLYFDIDNKEPEVNEFSITGKTSSGDTLDNGFTYQTDNIPYTLTYDDKDVTQYCISNTSECTEWKEIKEKTNTLTIDTSDGEKTIYIYLKDKANNVSVTTNKSTAKIIVDRTKPKITSFTLTGAAESGQTLSSSTDYTHKVGITYNATIEESNISEYCVYEDSCSYQTTTSTTLNTNYTLKDTEGSHSVKIKVKDKAGNESDITTQSIKLDKTNPTATIKSNTQDTSSITVTVGYSGTDTIIARQCRISLPTVGEWKNTEADGSCTISSLDDGTEYTIEGRVRDSSGRWNTTYSNVSVTTDKAGFRGTGKQLIDYNPKGLTETEIGGMYRFVGACDAKDGGCDNKVDNFICFGYSNISQCSTGIMDNDYIYRIIGITADGKMKLIKNSALNDKTYQWWDTDVENVEWPDSLIYSAINGSDFLIGLSQNWQFKIVKTTWLYGNMGRGRGGFVLDNSADEVYNIETGVSYSVSDNVDGVGAGEARKWTESVSAKVGLMYVSDYYYSYDGVGTTNCYSDYKTCVNSWLHIGRNENYALSNYEWTMVGMGYDGNGSLNSWMLKNDGSVTYDWINAAGVVRPVFYLASNEEILSGNGTTFDPFVVNSVTVF